MILESLAAGVVANLVYESTKKGISLTKDYLMKELIQSVDSDQKNLEYIAEQLIKLDQSEELEDLSKKGIIKKINKCHELAKALNSIKQESVKNTINQYHYGTGDNVGGDKYC
ncbi:hypothetical protein [Marinospirillum sp.]|uniref:hypothetical protein n=1 Tax=Marinospirillum sp. TaxID=2183934 RepID=UPI00286FDC7F|nr:hypothetical protein [Marinospirillum sp.]MDR9468871.1 hypothetical protein [Marinospirillum sp.]